MRLFHEEAAFPQEDIRPQQGLDRGKDPRVRRQGRHPVEQDVGLVIAPLGEFGRVPMARHQVVDPGAKVRRFLPGQEIDWRDISIAMKARGEIAGCSLSHRRVAPSAPNPLCELSTVANQNESALSRQFDRHDPVAGGRGVRGVTAQEEKVEDEDAVTQIYEAAVI